MKSYKISPNENNQCFIIHGDELWVVDFEVAEQFSPLGGAELHAEDFQSAAELH